MRPSHRQAHKAGFSLIEVLVAMTIFAFITLATGFALTTALRTQASMRERAELLQEVRGITAILRRDLRSAFASQNNPNTMFMSGGSAEGSLVTFTALTGRIEWPDTAGETSGEEEPVAPHSDLRTISYAHDPETHTLTRIESLVPGTDAAAMASGQAGMPETVVSRRVANIAIEYYDSQNQQVRQEWTYSADPQMAESGVETDTSLPQSVHVEIELLDSEGMIERHTIVIALATPTPAPAGQTPPAAAATGGGSGTGSGSGTGGGTGGGGTGGGGTGGGGTGGNRWLPGLSGLGTRP